MVGPWDNLFYNTLKLVDCNFTGLETGEHKGLEVMIRGFGKNPKGNAQLTLNSDNTAIIHLENHAWAPSPGQPTVVYKGDTLLGGGYLIDSYNKD